MIPSVRVRRAQDGNRNAPQGGGRVPKNPFASLAQEGYLHAHPEKLGKAGLKEWDAATKGEHLPERVKK